MTFSHWPGQCWVIPVSLCRYLWDFLPSSTNKNTLMLKVWQNVRAFESMQCSWHTNVAGPTPHSFYRRYQIPPISVQTQMPFIGPLKLLITLFCILWWTLAVSINSHLFTSHQNTRVIPIYSFVLKCLSEPVNSVSRGVADGGSGRGNTLNLGCFKPADISCFFENISKNCVVRLCAKI